MRARRVRITDTTLRDGHQSLWATRMRTQRHAAHPRDHGRGRLPLAGVLGRRHLRRLPALPGRGPVGAPAAHQEARRAHAAADAAARPEPRRLPPLRRRHRARASCYKAAENGMDIFRVFDALNDIRNFETAAAAIKETRQALPGRRGLHHLARCTRSTTTWTWPAAWSTWAPTPSASRTWRRCSRPTTPSSSSAASRPRSTVPIQLHCHYIGGLAPMTYLKAVEAGVDVIDTATVPLAFGNSPAGHRDGRHGAHRHALRHRARPGDSCSASPSTSRACARRRGHERGVTSLTHMQVYSHQVPGRHDQQPREPAQGAERAGPAARGARGDPRGPRRGRLSRRWSRRCRRSSARRPCSTCSPGGAGTSCPTR